MYATFQSIDPATELPPDVLIGFLPPEDGTGRGMGHISYVVRPEPGLPTGTEIRNVALISFDGQPQIATDQVDPHDPSKGIDPAKQCLNTIDAGAPISSVQELPAVVSSARFEVNWSGIDDLGGSGIASYDIYVSDNGGPYALWLEAAANTSATFTGLHGHAYAFYAVAEDNVGNREEPAAEPDAVVAVNVPDLGPIDLKRQVVDLSTGERWYRAQASRVGYMTLEAIGTATPENVQLALFDATMNRLGDSQLVRGIPRIDYDQAVAGQSFYIQVVGTASDVELRIANLVSLSGNISGTAGADQFEFNADDLWFSIDDVRYDFPAGTVSSFHFDGGTGINTATVWGSTNATQKDSAALYATRGTMSGPGYSLSLAGTRGITVYGNGGPDDVYVYDSSLDDTFTATPTYITLSNSRFTNRAEKFRNVFAYAQVGGAFLSAGGSDTANFYGLDGTRDYLRASAMYAIMADSETGRGMTYFVRGNWFEQVHAYGRELDGRPSPVDRDQAILLDAKTVDLFEAETATASAVYAFSGASTINAYRFRVVKAYGKAGDTANLYGPGQYKSSPNPVMWTEDYTVWANGFNPINWYPDGRPIAPTAAVAWQPSNSERSPHLAALAAEAALASLWDDDGDGCFTRKKLQPAATDLAILGLR